MAQANIFPDNSITALLVKRTMYVHHNVLAVPGAWWTTARGITTNARNSLPRNHATIANYTRLRRNIEHYLSNDTVANETGILGAQILKKVVHGSTVYIHMGMEEPRSPTDDELATMEAEVVGRSLGPRELVLKAMELLEGGENRPHSPAEILAMIEGPLSVKSYSRDALYQMLSSLVAARLIDRPLPGVAAYIRR